MKDYMVVKFRTCFVCHGDGCIMCDNTGELIGYYDLVPVLEEATREMRREIAELRGEVNALSFVVKEHVKAIDHLLLEQEGRALMQEQYDAYYGAVGGPDILGKAEEIERQRRDEELYGEW